MSTIWALDVSGLVHAAFYATPVTYGADKQPINAIEAALGSIAKIVREHRPTHMVAALDCAGPTWRHDVFPTYKAKRALKPKPPELVRQLKAFPTFLRALGIPALQRDGLEGEDVIAGIVDCADAEVFDTVVVANDTDLMQLVREKSPNRTGVCVYNPRTQKFYDTAAVTAYLGVEPRRIPDLIGLMGDAGDDIPGVNGIGEKYALSLLDEVPTVEQLIEYADLDKWLSKTDAPKGHVWDKLRRHCMDARMSKHLGTLRSGWPEDFAMHDAKWGNPDEERWAILTTETGLHRYDWLVDSRRAPG